MIINILYGGNSAEDKTINATGKVTAHTSVFLLNVKLCTEWSTGVGKIAPKVTQWIVKMLSEVRLKQISIGILQRTLYDVQ